jgi:hypothetical protein
VVELLVLGSLAFAAFVVLSVVASVFGLVMWLVALPFRILGWVFSGALMLLAVPFVLVFAVLGVVIFGAGLLFFLLPALPIVLLAWGAWWLVKRNQRSAATATH